MKHFKFSKEHDNRWYIVLPEWTGDKADLEMVCGADLMLDIVAQGELEVELSISEKPFETHTLELHFIREENDGAWYNLKSEFHNFEVWLCFVTKFIYGKMPQTLYCK